jgi:hypothetical protein
VHAVGVCQLPKDTTMTTLIRSVARLVKPQADVPLKLPIKNRRVYWAERLRGAPTALMFLKETT